MDVKSYCDSVGIELTGWKAKLYDVIRKSEGLSAAGKAEVGPLVEDLNGIMDDLNERIVRLGAECPAEWSASRTDIEDKVLQLKGKWKQVWGVMGESEYGIGGA